MIAEKGGGGAGNRAMLFFINPCGTKMHTKEIKPIRKIYNNT